MPKYRVTRNRVEYQQSETIVEADSPEQAEQALQDMAEYWTLVNANESTEFVEKV